MISFQNSPRSCPAAPWYTQMRREKTTPGCLVEKDRINKKLIKITIRNYIQPEAAVATVLRLSLYRSSKKKISKNLKYPRIYLLWCFSNYARSTNVCANKKQRQAWNDFFQSDATNATFTTPLRLFNVPTTTTRGGQNLPRIFFANRIARGEGKTDKFHIQPEKRTTEFIFHK